MTIGARIWNRKRLIAAIVGPTVVMGALLLSPEVRDRVALHGTWTIVSVQSSGTSTAVRRGGQVTFDGMTSAFLFVGSSGRFTLDPGAALKGIDMKVDLPEGSVPANGWDGILHGLYELDGSTLRFCWMPGRNERPATIPAAPTPGVEVLVLRRTKTR
jgi:uncharacterized protein (TIGR03067 family)